MFDLRFIEIVVLDARGAARRIEDFFLQACMDDQLSADLPRDLFLLLIIIACSNLLNKPSALRWSCASIPIASLCVLVDWACFCGFDVEDDAVFAAVFAMLSLQVIPSTSGSLGVRVAATV